MKFKLFFRRRRCTSMSFAKRKTRLLQQVIPPEDLDTASEEPGRRSFKYLHRPGFSLPLMTSNFRRFNARYP